MQNKKFYKGEIGVAGVVEAILIIALIAIILSTIQVFYIPQIMEQREADHMDQVANQFSRLKSTIDIQSMTKKDFPITTSIKLGSKEIPYFVTARAYGTLSILDNKTYNITIESTTKSKTVPLTDIVFEAYNSYFVDQDYILEGGSLIINQDEGETITVEPNLEVNNNSNNISIYYDIPVIKGIKGKKYASGYKNCFIRTNYSTSDENWVVVSNASIVNISTKYTEAWKDLLSDLLDNNVNIDKGSNYVEISRKNKKINFHYRCYYIYAQISPGWV